MINIPITASNIWCLQRSFVFCNTVINTTEPHVKMATPSFGQYHATIQEPFGIKCTRLQYCAIWVVMKRISACILTGSRQDSQMTCKTDTTLSGGDVKNNEMHPDGYICRMAWGHLSLEYRFAQVPPRAWERE